MYVDCSRFPGRADMGTELVIGCPASHREWCIKQYLDHAAESATVAGFEPSFLFVPGHNDSEMLSIIHDSGYECEIWDIQNLRESDRRDWCDRRYHQMVELRNALLARVREIRPKFFLSLDSDILLDPKAITSMMELTANYDAVGGKTYMTSGGTKCPSYGMITRNGRMRRSESDQVLKVDVVMAIKLMNRAAYHVDYQFHDQGEDIGWSLNCKRKGLLLGWDGRVPNKHLMNQGQLNRVDNRIGW